MSQVQTLRASPRVATHPAFRLHSCRARRFADAKERRERNVNSHAIEIVGRKFWLPAHLRRSQRNASRAPSWRSGLRLTIQDISPQTRSRLDYLPENHPDRDGGAERNRTADLLIANEALYQLSYGPRKGAE